MVFLILEFNFFQIVEALIKSKNHANKKGVHLASCHMQKDDGNGQAGKGKTLESSAQ